MWKNQFSFGEGFYTDFRTVTIDHSDTPPISRRSLVEGYLLDCKVTGKSLATIEYYAEKFNKFLWYAENFGLPENVADITREHIRQFQVAVLPLHGIMAF